MKKRAAIFLAVVLFHGVVLSQYFLPGSIEFTTQQQIDNFHLKYPCCAEVEGDVSINGHLIDSLGGLSGLTSIKGDLRIGTHSSAITFYTDLKGLQNLKSIGGNLEIVNNGSLQSLAGLENLAFVGGDLKIINNIPLTDLSALSKLVQVGGSISISSNQALGNLFGLHNIPRVNGNLLIHENPELVAFFGLHGLSEITGNLQIIGNKQLASFFGLDNLVHIRDTFLVSNNPALVSMDGLGHLAIIGGGMQIGDDQNGNRSLQSLEGLKNLSTIRKFIRIEHNDALESLEGLENISPLSVWDLQITDNHSLSNCAANGIANYLSHPSGQVEIKDNAEGCNNPSQVAAMAGIGMPCLPYGNYYFNHQEDIDNFARDYPGCSMLTGDILISGSNIINLKGLETVTSISGNLVIYDNDSLASLAGLENLTSISQGFYLGENDLLQDLQGLNNLREIGDFLEINFNKRLSSLHGLENLVVIDNMIHIEGNNSLHSLTALENIDASYLEYFTVINNFNLSTCEIRNICNYLHAPGQNISFFNNASGCRNLYEVETACIFSDHDLIQLSDQCAYYSNPATGEITFSFELHDPMNVKLVIYDSKGIVKATIVEDIMDRGKHHIHCHADLTSPGVYFYNLTAGLINSSGELIVSR